MTANSSTHATEIAIIGAGIVGLAHALAAARQGYRVTVFERNERAIGASIRNFGMVWPVGQPFGPLRDRALRSRQIWLELAAVGNFFRDPVGSLHLAYHPDELAVIEEFVDGVKDATVQVLTPDQVAQKSSAAVTTGLLGALWSETEVIVDAREAIVSVAEVLRSSFNVIFGLAQRSPRLTLPISP